MKYKITGITGLLLIVLGATLIILQLMANEKSVIRSIAVGASPISVGCMLIGVSRMFARKNASRNRSNASIG
jgi:predicted phage tail protein